MSKDILLKNGIAVKDNDVRLKRDQKTKGGILLKSFILETLAEETCCTKNIVAVDGTFSGDISAVNSTFTTVTSDTVTVTKGAVTQATSKTTGVTLNTNAGTITTVALTDAADASFTFTLTNSKISSTSVVVATVDINGGNGVGNVNITPGTGSATIKVTNVGTAAFNSAIKIKFVVL